MLTYRRPSALRLFALVFAVVAGLTIALGAMLSSAQAAGLFKFTQYKVPTDNSEPRHITVGSDGNLWFTEGNEFFTSNPDPDTGGTFHNQIGRITPGGEITEFRVDGCQCFLNDIVQGPDDVLYFTTNNQGLGRITTSGEVLPTVEPGNFSALGNGVAAHGDDVWYTDFNNDSLWRYDVPSGEFTQFVVPTPDANPFDVAVDANGIVWFTEAGALAAIGRLDPADGTFTETPVTGSSPRHIAIASDGKVWFTDRFSHRVGYLDPSNDQVSQFDTLTPNAGPQDIAAAEDGSVWFTQARVGNVARITPDGTITEEGKAVKDDPNSGLESAFGITIGPDGRSVWYTKPANNQIARLTPR
jgi:virginiamycin B lyase